MDNGQPGEDRDCEVRAMRFLSDEASDRIDRVLHATTDNFVELVHIAGLSPASDFRYKHLRRIDFVGSDLSPFDFTGTTFDTCKFEAARFGGAALEHVEFRNCNPGQALDWHLIGPSLPDRGENGPTPTTPAFKASGDYSGGASGNVPNDLAALAETGGSDPTDIGLDVAAEMALEHDQSDPYKTSFWQNLFAPSRNDMAIALGTTNFQIWLRGRGIVLNEPSVAAVVTVNGVRRVKAVGDDAKLMAETRPDAIDLIRPIRRGVIADIDVAEQMIKHFIQKVYRRSLFTRGPQIVICVPSASTSAERRVVRDAASYAGARQVWLIEEPMAAAIGAGMPVTEPIGSMVVDIGGGTTEAAVLSLRGLAYTTSVAVGGDSMDEAISSYLRRHYSLLIGEATAERIKKQVGIAKPPTNGDGLSVHIKGRVLVSGVPKEVVINQRQ
ncbi:MAG: rod shape-determining protein MreB, partial [Sphingomonadales bacterium]|nr:rod shape-determining protein MreB [Sphingomonadales bacterium]